VDSDLLQLISKQKQMYHKSGNHIFLYYLHTIKSTYYFELAFILILLCALDICLLFT